MLTNLILTSLLTWVSLNPISFDKFNSDHFNFNDQNLIINFANMANLINYDIFDQTKFALDNFPLSEEQNLISKFFIDNNQWYLLSISAISGNILLSLILNKIYPNLGNIYIYSFNIIESSTLIVNLIHPNNKFLRKHNNFKFKIISLTF